MLKTSGDRTSKTSPDVGQKNCGGMSTMDAALLVVAELSIIYATCLQQLGPSSRNRALLLCLVANLVYLHLTS